MKVECLVIVGIVILLVSGCTMTGQRMVSPSDYFNGDRHAGVCVDPDQR